MILGATGSLWGSSSWYLVAMGQYRTVLLVLTGTRPVLGSTVWYRVKKYLKQIMSQGPYASTYYMPCTPLYDLSKSGDLVLCHRSLKDSLTHKKIPPISVSCNQTLNLSNVLHQWDSRNFPFYPKKRINRDIFGKNWEFRITLIFKQMVSLVATRL